MELASDTVYHACCNQKVTQPFTQARAYSSFGANRALGCPHSRVPCTVARRHEPPHYSYHTLRTAQALSALLVRYRTLIVPLSGGCTSVSTCREEGKSGGPLAVTLHAIPAPPEAVKARHPQEGALHSFPTGRTKTRGRRSFPFTLHHRLIQQPRMAKCSRGQEGRMGRPQPAMAPPARPHHGRARSEASATQTNETTLHSRHGNLA